MQNVPTPAEREPAPLVPDTDPLAERVAELREQGLRPAEARRQAHREAVDALDAQWRTGHPERERGESQIGRAVADFESWRDPDEWVRRLDPATGRWRWWHVPEDTFRDDYRVTIRDEADDSYVDITRDGRPLLTLTWVEAVDVIEQLAEQMGTFTGPRTADAAERARKAAGGAR